LKATGDEARVSVTVRLPRDEAFALFTEGIDQWWRRGPRFRHGGAGSGLVHIEPGVGGRLFESIDDDNGPRIFEIGRVLVWEPPQRFVFSWRNATFATGEATEVEVEFRKVAGGTTVTVTHRGWSQLRPDHPARHGLADAPFLRMMGLWWGQQMSSLRELSLGQRSQP
jgi:uncharacterized protein YndB with AHSA1/START domain